jgi:TRAP-type C4-dicarboxylate transport system permease small subunit
MAGKKFLNPTIKIIICLLAIAVLGYFVVQEALFQNDPVNKFLIGRILVMIGFAYLLVQSLREMFRKP